MFILFFYFSLSFRQPDQQPRIVPASALFFFLLTEGFRPLPSSCLFIASFQCSLRRFLFGKRLQRYCLYFKPPNFSRTFFSSFFFRTPRPRRSDALRHHAKASRPPVCFAFAVAKVLPFTFPAKLFRIFFCPFFQLFSQSPIYQRVIRTKKSPVIHQECQRFLLFPEFSPHYASRAPFGPS